MAWLPIKAALPFGFSLHSTLANFINGQMDAKNGALQNKIAT